MKGPEHSDDGNLKRETEFLLIAAQNNVIRTNHIKAKSDDRQHNIKCELYGDRLETVNLKRNTRHG